ncbi:MAG: caspase family protein [Theionarchaea archaeon]|nr:caspase family protein [Theionarchaea archaeon]
MGEYALIIGIDQYKDKRIPSLSWAREDAKMLHEVLNDLSYWRISPENVTLLVDENATRGNILRKIREMQRSVQENDTVLIHFSGHGCHEHDEVQGYQDDRLSKYLAPCDTDVDNLIASAIDFKFFAAQLDRIRSEKTIVTLDCCYSGAAGGRTFLKDGYREVERYPVGESFLRDAFGVGRAIITACECNELAKESSRIGHGILSHCLIEGLTGKADLRDDEAVDLDELWLYLSNEIPKISNDEQHPVLIGWLRGPSLALTHSGVEILTEEKKKKIESDLAKKYSNYRLQVVRIANDSSFESLAFEAARYLDQQLKNCFKISISCGRTLYNTISQMNKSELHNIDVFPLNAFLSDIAQPIDANMLTDPLRIKITGDNILAHRLPNLDPTVFEPEIRGKVIDAARKEASKTFELAKRSDIFLLGIGQPTTTSANVAYVLDKANLTPDKLKEMDVVGEINFHLYNKDGQFLMKDSLSEDQREYLGQYYDQFFAFSAEDLKEVAERPGVNLIAIAGGKEKKEAILGAIRGGLVRTLITDAETAKWLAYMV